MKILIFGEQGQLAQSFADVAVDFPEIDLVFAGRSSCDITQKEQVSQTLDQVKPDLIINTAAYTAVDQAEDEPEAAFELNEMGVEHIAKSAEVPVIHFSTDYVFDGEATKPYAPSDITAPLGVYGESKLKGEEALRETCSRHIIIRTAWVYSPFGQNFVKTMLRLMAERDKLTIVDDQKGAPTSAIDLAFATLSIAPKITQNDFVGFGTYHLTSEDSISWYDFACEILKQAKLDCVLEPIPTSAFPTKAKRPKYSVLSVSKFKETFDISLPDWQTGLSKTLEKLENTK